MIIDDTLEFCDATAILLTAATTAVVGDVIDLGSVQRDIGAGKPMYLVLSVNTSFAAGNGATFKLTSDSAAALTTAPVDHWTSQPLTNTTGVAGKKFVIPLPSGDAVPYKRYLGIRQTNGATTAFTAGAIDAYLAFGPVAFAFAADAVN